MTVAGEATAVPTVDRAAAEQQYNEIYRKFWRPLTYFISVRVDARHASHAEDIAAEAFIELWTKFLSAGKEVYGPWGLLCFMGRQLIGNFYSRLAASRETAVDFGDPLNGRLAVGHSYASDQPDAASIATDLSTAMEAMTALSQKWRDAHTKTSMYRSRLEGGTFPMRPETRAATEQRLADLISESDQLLKDFRGACALVGELRRDLEAAGGPNWCSSTGMPPTAMRNWTKDKGTMSDPTRSHCDDGHELTLENTLFTKKGAKRCRTCMEVSWRASRAANPPKSKAKVPGQVQPHPKRVPEEKIQRARQLLRDTDMSIRQVAAEVGIGRATLSDRIPDLDQLRDAKQRRRAGNAPVSDELLDRAVQLLTDPANRRSVRAVCAELGFSDATLYTRVPNLAAMRREAYAKPLAGAAR